MFKSNLFLFFILITKVVATDVAEDADWKKLVEDAKPLCRNSHFPIDGDGKRTDPPKENGLEPVLATVMGYVDNVCISIKKINDKLSKTKLSDDIILAPGVKKPTDLIPEEKGREEIKPTTVTPVVGARPTTVTPAKGSIPTTVTPAKGAIPTTVTPAKGAIPTTVTPVEGAIPTTVTPVKGVIPTTVTPVEGPIPTTVTPVKEGIPIIVTPVKGAIPTTVTPVEGPIPTTVTPAKGAIPTTVTHVEEAIPTTVTPVKGAIPTTVTSAKGAIPTTVTPVEGAIPTTVTPVKGVIPTTVTPVEGAIPTTVPEEVEEKTAKNIIETVQPTETSPIAHPSASSRGPEKTYSLGIVLIILFCSFGAGVLAAIACKLAYDRYKGKSYRIPPEQNMQMGNAC